LAQFDMSSEFVHMVFLLQVAHKIVLSCLSTFVINFLKQC